jgi:outer membrane murein-binding lipoprotein Lpp
MRRPNCYPGKADFEPGRSFVVRTTRSTIAAAVLAAVFVAGCGGEEPANVDLSKKTDTTQFKGMMDDMKGNIKANKSGRP